MATQTERLPYSVGRFTPRLYLLIGVLVVLVAVGAFAYSLQLKQGEVVTGLRDIGTMGGATWGLYIVFVVYFVGVSFAGITTAALIRIFNLTHLKPVSRIAELLTVVALLLAALTILPDLGRPVRGIVNLLRYARPQSPFFGTFTLVISGYLFGSLVYLYLDGRPDAAQLAKVQGPLWGFHRLWAAGYRDTPIQRKRHEVASLWLAIAIVPLLVTAHSTLGFVFGLQAARPGWFGALQGPAFVVLAGVSGVGMLIVISAVLRRSLDINDQLNLDVFNWLGNLLMVLVIGYLYFMAAEWLTTTYASHHHEVSVANALLVGEYAWLYWGVVAAMAIALVTLALAYLPDPVAVRLPAVQLRYARATGAAALVVIVVLLGSEIIEGQRVSAALALAPGITRPLLWVLAILLALLYIFFVPVLRHDVIARTVLSGVLVNLAAIGKRFLIVVPSQTHGTLLPYLPGTYRPTWVEYSIILGLFALGTLLYALFVKVFPIIEVSEPIEESVPYQVGLETDWRRGE